MNVTETLQYLPPDTFGHAALFFVCVCMPLGIVGNGLVLYAFRIEASAFNSLVTFLAFVDLLACVFHMPLDIASLFNPYIFPDEAICKISCFMIAFTAISSSALFIAIAVNRYRAVCRPHAASWSVRIANLIAAFTFISALILSWPVVLLFGVATIDVRGTVYAFCGVQNKYMTKTLPRLFYLILSIMFFVALCTLSILYIITGRELWMKRKIFAEVTTHNRVKPQDGPSGDNHASIIHVELVSDAKMKPDISQVQRDKVTANDKKTAKSFRIMFSVSLLFFLSYTPHLVLVFYFMISNVAAFPVHAWRAWYTIVTRSYYIHNVVDPFIYGFFSQDFRRKIKTIPERMNRLLNRCCLRS